jgi:uncharacterized protein (PEP-CTERM system associated)
VAGAERCGTARGESRSAGSHLGATFIGLAVAVGLAAQAPAAFAQEAPAAPAPAGPPAAGDQGEATAPGAPGAPLASPGAGVGTGPAGPAWIITPSIQATQSFTDNVLSTPTQHQADAYTTLTPSLAISGQSARLQGTFNYSPQAIFYAHTSSQDQVLQNLFSNGTLTAVPNLLFFDGSASIVNTSRFGGYGYNNAAQVPTSAATQTIVYTGSPYVQLHFGDWGNAEARYSFSQDVFTGNTGTVADTNTGQNLGAISNMTQQSATFKYNTGERFARLQLSFLSSYAQVDSVDNTLNSKDASDTINAAYAVTNQFSALFGGGFERLIYAQEGPLDFTGPTWNAGFKWKPRVDRMVTLTYGEQQGQDAFNGSMLYTLRGGAALSASYSESTTNQQQQILQNLSVATQITPGLTVNQQTGLPQSIVNPNLALQNGILRVKNFQTGVLFGNERNHYTVSFDRNQENALSAGGLNQTTNGGIASWGRDMTPLTTGTMTAAYSSTTSNGTGSTTGTGNATIDVLTFGLSFAFALNDTLSASAGYSLSRQSGGTGGAVLVDIVSVSLQKRF